MDVQIRVLKAACPHYEIKMIFSIVVFLQKADFHLWFFFFFWPSDCSSLGAFILMMRKLKALIHPRTVQKRHFHLCTLTDDKKYWISTGAQQSLWSCWWGNNWFITYLKWMKGLFRVWISLNKNVSVVHLLIWSTVCSNPIRTLCWVCCSVLFFKKHNNQLTSENLHCA